MKSKQTFWFAFFIHFIILICVPLITNLFRIMRKEHLHKGWNEIKTNDSWAIFKIMGEFVNGYEKLSKIGPCVSIFGSARTKPNQKYYQLAENIAKKIVEAGYGVITGGGPGIMEAGNKGAHLGGGTSVGLNIELPFVLFHLSFESLPTIPANR